MQDAKSAHDNDAQKMIIVERIKAIKMDIKKVKDYTDSFYTWDSCNCKTCLKKRNKNKYKILIKSITTFSMFSLLDVDYFELSYLKKFMSRLIDNLKFNDMFLKTDLKPTTHEIDFCGICGKIIIKSRENEKGVCSECLEQFYTTCAYCGKIIQQCLKIDLPVEKEYCKECMKKTKECIICRERHTEGNYITEFVDNNSHKREFTSPTFICLRCFGLLTPCSSCGILTMGFVLTLSGICPICQEQNKDVHDYGYIPTKINFQTHETKMKIDSLFLGIEMEVENSEKGADQSVVARKCKNAFGKNFIYCKHDGSLLNGFEFVSHPFTWEWFVKNKYRFNQLCSTAKLCNLHTDGSTTGIHIHMTKSAFTQCQLFKFIQFINKQINRPKINKIANRDIESCTFCQPIVTQTKNVALIAKYKSNTYSDRYIAVNLERDKTVEIRIFAGSLEPKIIFSYVEFVYSLFNFTKKTPSKMCTFKNYTSYLKENKTKYINIYNRLK